MQNGYITSIPLIIPFILFSSMESINMGCLFVIMTDNLKFRLFKTMIPQNLISLLLEDTVVYIRDKDRGGGNDTVVITVVQNKCFSL